MPDDNRPKSGVTHICFYSSTWILTPRMKFFSAFMIQVNKPWKSFPKTRGGKPVVK